MMLDILVTHFKILPQTSKQLLFFQHNIWVDACFNISEIAKRNRNYFEDYIQFGFISILDGGEVKGQCALRQKVLGNESLRPPNLILHLGKTHPQYKCKNMDFKLMEESVKSQRLDATGGLCKQSRHLTEACYTASLFVALQKKPHRIGETLVKPFALGMARIVLGEVSKQQLAGISLSNNTVQRRIRDLAQAIKEQVILRYEMHRLFFWISWMNPPMFHCVLT